MKTLYFDCFAGISGDMTLAALVDLGVPSEYLLTELHKIHLHGWELSFERRVKNGISANYAKVEVHEHEHHHDHHHDHEHEHHHHEHTHNSHKEIVNLIEQSGITDGAKALSIAIFAKVAEAEAKVHGTTPEDVHFHEVGAADSIIDCVGAAICVDYLKPDKIAFSALNDGRGFTWCQHGQIPVPVPAVLEICAQNSIPINQIDIDKELVTPTGAGIAAALASSFGLPQGFRAEKTGLGAGTRDIKIPNVLRVMWGETDETPQSSRFEQDEISIIETNIDDCPAEITAYATEKLLQSGALDVWATPIVMKKGRTAITLSVICPPENVEKLAEIIFRETTAIGVRTRRESRLKLPRAAETVQTPYGNIQVKTVTIGNETRRYPEFEDAKRLADAANKPLIEIYRAVK